MVRAIYPKSALNQAMNQVKACRLSGAKPFLESKLTQAIGAQMSLPLFKGQQYNVPEYPCNAALTHSSLQNFFVHPQMVISILFSPLKM